MQFLATLEGLPKSINKQTYFLKAKHYQSVQTLILAMLPNYASLGSLNDHFSADQFLLHLDRSKEARIHPNRKHGQSMGLLRRRRMTGNAAQKEATLSWQSRSQSKLHQNLAKQGLTHHTFRHLFQNHYICTLAGQQSQGCLVCSDILLTTNRHDGDLSRQFSCHLHHRLQQHQKHCRNLQTYEPQNFQDQQLFMVL